MPTVERYAYGMLENASERKRDRNELYSRTSLPAPPRELRSRQERIAATDVAPEAPAAPETPEAPEALASEPPPGDEEPRHSTFVFDSFIRLLMTAPMY